MLGEGAGRKSAGAGWEAVHVAVDDATRLAYVEVLPDQTATTAVGFLRRAIAWIAEQGVCVRAVMRQRQRLHLRRLSEGLQGRGPHPHPHPALPATHQRQSRAIHPDPAPRMGLRTTLAVQPGTPPRAGTMADLLQHQATPRLPRPQAAPHSPGGLTNVPGNYT
jgi:hypothetical protein